MNDKNTYQHSHRVHKRAGHIAPSKRATFGPGNVAEGIDSVFSSYTRLMALLAEGWEIEPPVYFRPRWHQHSHSGKEYAYHFILWDRNNLNLISVLDCPELQQFLTDNNLAVDLL